MDKIQTSDTALAEVRTALSTMGGQVKSASDACATAMEQQLPYLDEAFRVSVKEAVDLVRRFGTETQSCADANCTAIDERLLKLSDYEEQTYHATTYA